jgi:hypothetical protein
MIILLGSVTEARSMSHRKRHWNQVGLLAKADFWAGLGKRHVAFDLKWTLRCFSVGAEVETFGISD